MNYSYLLRWCITKTNEHEALTSLGAFSGYNELCCIFLVLYSVFYMKVGDLLMNLYKQQDQEDISDLSLDNQREFDLPVAHYCTVAHLVIIQSNVE